MIREESFALLQQEIRRTEPAPETMNLLRTTWPRLSPADRLALLAGLGEPASSDELESWRGDHELHVRLLRQWRWLAGIPSDQLPNAWKAAKDRLSSVFGEGDPEARRFGVSVRTGSISPMSAVEIADLGPEDFAERAREWSPPPSGWEAPTPAGLAQELSQAVQESPRAWIGGLPGLAEELRHPTYIRAVLDGLREVLPNLEDVDWSALVDTFELVVSEPWSVERLTDDDSDADPDWMGCDGVVVRLAQESFDRDTSFDDATLERLWAVLLTTMRKRQSGSGVIDADLLTAAINKLSTTALQAMFSLALSVSRQDRDLTHWSDLLMGAITEELGIDGEEAYLARGIVASLFPQFVHICGDRAKDLIPQVFGAPEPSSLRVQAFETLVKWSRPISNDLLIVFGPFLHAYLDSDRSIEAEEEGRQAVRWLMIGYMRRLQDQMDPSELLSRLERPSRISEGAEFYGRVLRDTPEPDPELVEAGVQFWDEALRTPGLEAEAFHGFGWWAEATSIDDKAWLERIHATLQLTHGRIDWADEVVHRLVQLRSFPEAWKSLSLLVKGAPDQWEVSYWARHLQVLFKETGDVTGEMRRLRSELAERLLERELLDFRQYIR